MEYKKIYAKKLLDFFSYGEGKGLPSFAKFAVSIGALSSDLNIWREKHEDFSLAYDECVTRLCDMLADGALIKRFDPSFVKFLLSSKYGFSEEKAEESNTPFEVKITVLEDKKEKEGDANGN